MFCERCGKLIDDARNFCNGCGAPLKREADNSKSVISSLTSALISIVVVGLGVLVALTAILMDKMDGFDSILKFIVIYLAALVGISFMIVRQLSKVIDAKVLVRPQFKENAVPPVQLAPPVTAQLEEFRTPASVIEKTTRILDKVPR